MGHAFNLKSHAADPTLTVVDIRNQTAVSLSHTFHIYNIVVSDFIAGLMCACMRVFYVHVSKCVCVCVHIHETLVH